MGELPRLVIGWMQLQWPAEAATEFPFNWLLFSTSFLVFKKNK